MARIHIDGFESGSLRDYSCTGTPATVDAQGGPPWFPNAGLAVYNGTLGSLTYAIPGSWRKRLWFAFRWQASTSAGAHLTSEIVARVWNGSSELLRIETDYLGSLQIRDAAAHITSLGVGSSAIHAQRLVFDLDLSGSPKLTFYPASSSHGREVTLSVSSGSVITALSLESWGYYDDLVLDDSERPADRIIIGLEPKAAGDREQWANSGAGAAFEDLDEVPPDHTDYISTTATGRMELVRIADPTSTMRSIDALRVLVSPEEAGTGDNIVDAVRPLALSYPSTYRAGGMELSTAGPITPTTAGGTSMVFSTDPATGQPWTRMGVVNIQAGAMADYSDGPSSIPDVHVWLEADWIDPITDGERLWDTWFDLSGGLANRRDPKINHYDTATPTYYANVINGHPVVRIAKWRSFRFFSLAHDPCDWTWVFAFEPDLITGGWNYLLGSTTLILGHQINAGKLGILDADGVWKEVSTPAAGWQVLTFRLSTQDGVQVYRNGVSIVSNPSAYRRTELTSDAVCIGSNTDRSGGWGRFDFFGLVGVPRALTDAELNKVHAYFGAKLGLSVTAL